MISARSILGDGGGLLEATSILRPSILSPEDSAGVAPFLGNFFYTGVYGSEPGAATGDGYLPSNASVVEIDDGASWAQWGPLYPLTQPALTDFAWVNQGAATATQVGGGIYMYSTWSGMGAGDWHILKKAAPVTPYTVTAAFLRQSYHDDYNKVGLVFRQSSNGKLHSFAFGLPDTPSGWLGGETWTNHATWDATYRGVTWPCVDLLWLRIADDGTDRICSYSHDGQVWTVFHSIGRTDFLTADEVGFGINPQMNHGWVDTTLLSWKEA